MIVGGKGRRKVVRHRGFSTGQGQEHVPSLVYEHLLSVV